MYIGLTFKRERYSEITEMLQDHARLFDRKLEMYLMVDLNLLELHFKSMDLAVIDRVLLYDYEELGNWENFKRFSNLCRKFGLEFSIIKKTVDLHSDVDVPIGYLTEIIQ